MFVVPEWGDGLCLTFEVAGDGTHPGRPATYFPLECDESQFTVGSRMDFNHHQMSPTPSHRFSSLRRHGNHWNVEYEPEQPRFVSCPFSPV